MGCTRKLCQVEKPAILPRRSQPSCRFSTFAKGRVSPARVVANFLNHCYVQEDSTWHTSRSSPKVCRRITLQPVRVLQPGTHFHARGAADERVLVGLQSELYLLIVAFQGTRAFFASVRLVDHLLARTGVHPAPWGSVSATTHSRCTSQIQTWVTTTTKYESHIAQRHTTPTSCAMFDAGPIHETRNTPARPFI